MTPPPAPPTRDRVLRLLERMRTVRVVVLGDAMLDRYLIGDTDRLSPEAPVPVVTVRETRAALGGAANVAANVAAIGARCHLVAAVGDDLHGRAFRETLRAVGLDDRALVEPSEVVAERVVKARAAAAARWVEYGWRCNAEASGAVLRSPRWRLPARILAPLRRALDTGALSARGYDRIIRLAWTVADLDGRDRPDAGDVHEATELRTGMSW